MIDVALGALLGLGIWVVIGGVGRSPLAARLAPHLRDRVDSGIVGRRVGDIVDIVRLFWPHPVRVVQGMLSARRSVSRSNIETELPAFLDRAAVCLAAGLPVSTMFDRLGAGATGIIGKEAANIARDISVGIPLNTACTISEQRVRHDAWSRLIEHLVSAGRHGAPIAEIVRALAKEEQAAANRRLIEAAGAREIYMLLPLVFVILPMTVMVAVFPGLVALGSLPV